MATIGRLPVVGVLTELSRKLRETVKSFLDETHLMTYINIFKDGLLPKPAIGTAPASKVP